MATSGASPAEFPPTPANGSFLHSLSLPRIRRHRRWWINVLLFALTALSTATMGARMASNFARNEPALIDGDLEALVSIWIEPVRLLAGLPFAATLLAILLAHEMGHYLACRYYRIDATLPFFLPAPTLIGTLGAFIRIRSPLYSKRALFDIGIAGPLAGFLFLLPALAIGLAYSKVIPGIALEGDLIFGVPLLQHLFSSLLFPGVPASDLYLHPIARAAWVGMLATALNLLPIGQLDGGHILYAFWPRRHRLLSRLFVAALIPLGLFYSYSWLVWVFFLLIFGMRHPMVYDPAGLSRGRRWLGLLALVIFLLCFTPTPARLGAFES